MPAVKLAAALAAICMPPTPNYNQANFPIPKDIRIGELDYYPGRSDDLQLKTSRDVIDTLYIRVKASITVSGTAPTGPVKAGIAGLMKRLYIKVNDRDTVLDAKPFALTTLAKADYGNALQGDTTLSNATKDYELIFPIDFRLMRSFYPQHTGLDLRVANSVMLKADFGEIGDLFASPESAVLDNDSVVIEVFYKGKEHNRHPVGMEMRCLFEARKKVTVDDTTFEAIKINQQNSSRLEYTEFLRSLYIQGVVGEEAANILDEGQHCVVKIGSKVIIDEPLSVLRSHQKNLFDIPPAGGDFLYIPFFTEGDTTACPAISALSGGLTVQVGAKTQTGAEISTLVETIRRPVLA